MAKRKTPSKNGPAVWAEKPAGKPAKQCPKCQKWHHPRMGKCPGCGHEYPKAGKAKKAAPARRLPITGDFATQLRAAAGFVRAMGGTAQAKAAIDAIEQVRGL
jgi:hypothetical protein